jgi:hypothetical protein
MCCWRSRWTANERNCSIAEWQNGRKDFDKALPFCNPAILQCCNFLWGAIRSIPIVFVWGLVLAVAPAAQEVEIAAAVAFTEGPTADREGNVYFTDIMSQRIMKLSKDGVVSTYREHSNGANGLLIDPEGRLVPCEGAPFTRSGVSVKGKPQVTRTDLRTGRIEVLADNYEGKPLMGPNNVTIDGKGRLYFTDNADAAVYRIDAPRE